MFPIPPTINGVGQKPPVRLLCRSNHPVPVVGRGSIRALCHIPQPPRQKTTGAFQDRAISPSFEILRVVL